MGLLLCILVPLVALLLAWALTGRSSTARPRLPYHPPRVQLWPGEARGWV